MRLGSGRMGSRYATIALRTRNESESPRRRRSDPLNLLGIMTDVTKLLQGAAQGDPASANQLFDLVYAELRTIAVQKMATERPEHTLQPTALVNEAYLRLGGA